MRYRITLPNDYGSEEDLLALQQQFPDLSGDDLEVAAWEHIHELWPGLQLVEEGDFGGVYEASQPMPADLPVWVWASPVIG